jgi:dihydrodipicolinate synthase/N-acetylneuraminate lyase
VFEPALWAGVFPAALTMFTSSGDLDDRATRQHFESLVAEGADGLVVGGTSGEFIALDDRERRRVIELAVEAVAGRIPVIAGTGYFSTTQSVALTRFAAEAGADGAIVILPYYQRPTIGETLDHFRVVGRDGSLPVMVYNNPTNSGAPALEPDHLRTLHDEAVVVAVKSTFPTVHQIHELRAHIAPTFRVFYGSFMAPLEGLAGGAHGWISGILNVVTPAARRLADAVERSDLVAARTAWAEILPIKELYTRQPLGNVGDLSIYRAIIDARGGWGGHSRAPLAALTTDQRQRLVQWLRETAGPAR